MIFDLFKPTDASKHDLGKYLTLWSGVNILAPVLLTIPPIGNALELLSPNSFTSSVFVTLIVYLPLFVVLQLINVFLLLYYRRFRIISTITLIMNLLLFFFIGSFSFVLGAWHTLPLLLQQI